MSEKTLAVTTIAGRPIVLDTSNEAFNGFGCQNGDQFRTSGKGPADAVVIGVAPYPSPFLNHAPGPPMVWAIKFNIPGKVFPFQKPIKVLRSV